MVVKRIKQLKMFGLTLASCLILTACSDTDSVENNEYNEPIAEAEQEETGIDISEIEQVFNDECEGQRDYSKCAGQIIERLGENGYTAVDSENKVDMTNAENIRQFMNSQKSGEQAKVLVFQVSDFGGLKLIELDTDKGDVGVSQTYFSFEDGQLKKTVQSDFKADYFEYTDEGYLLIEGSWQSAQQLVLTMSDEEEHIALRVEPLKEQYRELCEKYMPSSSYKLNNMFLINWEEDNYNDLDFYDLFEKFYKETYGMNCPYNMNEDLSVSNEYEVTADEFENVILQHFKVSSEELHILLRYDADKNVYLYRPRGLDEYDYAEVPYPEVVAFEENDDGSVTLLVNAVYPNDNTSKLFSHKVTVMEEDGRIYYLSNEILGDEELNLWWHADRLCDD